MTDDTKDYKEYTLEADSELRFEIEQKDAKVEVMVSLDSNMFKKFSIC